MARCTAPIYGHRTASGRANCPVCGNSYGNYYSNFSYYSSYVASSSSSKNSGSGASGSNTSSKHNKTKARWASPGSTILYTTEEIRALTPVRKNYEERSKNLANVCQQEI